MLHILWMIIKFILIVVGILLGILVLSLLLFLFCPVRYRASAQKEEKRICVKGNVSWLFRGIQVRGSWSNQDAIAYDVVLFGISFRKWLSLFKRRKKPKEETENPKQLEEKLEEDFIESSSDEVQEIEITESETEDISEEETDRELEELEELEEIPLIQQEEAEEAEEEKSENKKSSIFVSFRQKLQEFLFRIKSLWNRFWDFLRGIQTSKEKLEKKKEKLLKKVSDFRTFVQDERFQGAVKVLRKALFRILKHVFPVKLTGEVWIGTEDPSQLGAILAVLGMTMPFHKNRIKVHPVYDEKVLEGEVKLKGRIYMIVFVYTGLKLWFDKNIKYLIKCWKKK